MSTPVGVTHLHFNLVKPGDTVNIDCSSFCGFEVLTFARQTHLGRAVPLYFKILSYPISSPGSQTLFVIQAISEFKTLLGFCPNLVFDRRFESPFLVEALLEAKVTFTIRLKAGKHAIFWGKGLTLRNLPESEKDCEVFTHGKNFKGNRFGTKSRIRRALVSFN